MHCVYDNPMTLRREIWRDGVLSTAVTREAMTHMKEFREQLGLDWSILTARPWRDGQIVGNPEALTTTPKPEGQGAETNDET